MKAIVIFLGGVQSFSFFHLGFLKKNLSIGEGRKRKFSGRPTIRLE